MQSSPSPPEYFVDRSLGRHDVPIGLQRQGLVVLTMASVYGAREQLVADEDWLQDATARAWIVLTKDKRLRFIVRRLRALHQPTLRVFILMSGNLTAEEQVGRFINNLERIEAAARERGPFVYGVYTRHIHRLWPASRSRR